MPTTVAAKGWQTSSPLDATLGSLSLPNIGHLRGEQAIESQIGWTMDKHIATL
jgi:hypothetical protein